MPMRSGDADVSSGFPKYTNVVVFLFIFNFPHTLSSTSDRGSFLFARILHVAVVVVESRARNTSLACFPLGEIMENLSNATLPYRLARCPTEPPTRRLAEEGSLFPFNVSTMSSLVMDPKNKRASFDSVYAGCVRVSRREKSESVTAASSCLLHCDRTGSVSPSPALEEVDDGGFGNTLPAS